MFHVPDRYRVGYGPWRTTTHDGNNGAFVIPCGASDLQVIASDGMGWEHVSVSLPRRCPTWDEMQHIKCIFWDAEDAVMQLHPPESVYVNAHPFCLHLWRPAGVAIPLPPSFMVGPKS